MLGVVVLVWGYYVLGNREAKNITIGFLGGGGLESKTVLPLGEGQVVESAGFDAKKYTHTVLGFSFEYLKGYSISSFGNYFDSNGETILLQKEGGGSGLQVLITPFDEEVSLTVSRIKKDLPKLSVLEPVEFTVDGKVKAVTFVSNNNLDTGKSFEAWFVYRRNLYQVSSAEESKELFEKVIKTWMLQE